jgi:hypothetical protein
VKDVLMLSIKAVGPLLICVVVANLTLSFAQSTSAMRVYLGSMWTTQTFLCDKGFPVDDCESETGMLKSHLQDYPVLQLGAWTWVLVRSDHWKQLGGDLGLDPTSPAYTAIEERLTLIDESILVPRDANRTAELINKFGMPISKLVDFAVTHEMGHALCGFKDEYKAELVGRRLREGELPFCSVPTKPTNKFPVNLQADVWQGTHGPIGAGSK